MDEGMGGRDFGAKPVKVGDELDVTIEAVAQKGDGIAKVQGFVIFVPGARQGETVKIRITDVRGRHAIAEKVG
jgi:predicted RNA-binding protein with TRAM domain